MQISTHLVGSHCKVLGQCYRVFANFWKLSRTSIMQNLGGKLKYHNTITCLVRIV